MKMNKYMLLAAAVLALVFTGCKTQDPFDTQSANDFPQILTPFNQSGPNYFTPELANPDVLFDDSVVVTPSAYTTVRWYLDDFEVWEGTHMIRTFRAGEYKLVVRATTTAGKSTERFSPLTVKPYDYEPYSAAQKKERYVMAGSQNTLYGQNLASVRKVLIANDYAGIDAVEATNIEAQDDALVYTVPADLAAGTYMVILEDGEGKQYGANRLFNHTAPLIMDGFYIFTGGKKWVIKGLDMDRITAITVGDTTYTEFLTQTATTIAITAPMFPAGEYTMSAVAGGQEATFLLADLTEVTSVKATGMEKQIISVCDGADIGYNGAPDWKEIKIDNGNLDWTTVAVGTTLYVEVTRPVEVDYCKFQILGSASWYPSSGDLEYAEAGTHLYTMELTQEWLNELAKDGLYAAGHGVHIERAYIDAPDEIIINAAPTNVGCNGDPDWKEKRVDNEYDWTTVVEGQTLRFYARRNPGTDYSKFSFFGTNEWRGQADIEPTNEESTPYEVKLTSAMINNFIASDLPESNRGLWVGGHGVIIDKITLE